MSTGTTGKVGSLIDWDEFDALRAAAGIAAHDWSAIAAGTTSSGQLAGELLPSVIDTVTGLVPGLTTAADPTPARNLGDIVAGVLTTGTGVVTPSTTVTPPGDSPLSALIAAVAALAPAPAATLTSPTTPTTGSEPTPLSILAGDIL